MLVCHVKGIVGVFQCSLYRKTPIPSMMYQKFGDRSICLSKLFWQASCFDLQEDERVYVRVYTLFGEEVFQHQSMFSEGSFFHPTGDKTHFISLMSSTMTQAITKIVICGMADI